MKEKFRRRLSKLFFYVKSTWCVFFYKLFVITIFSSTISEGFFFFFFRENCTCSNTYLFFNHFIVRRLRTYNIIQTCVIYTYVHYMLVAVMWNVDLFTSPSSIFLKKIGILICAQGHTYFCLRTYLCLFKDILISAQGQTKQKYVFLFYDIIIISAQENTHFCSRAYLLIWTYLLLLKDKRISV